MRPEKGGVVAEIQKKVQQSPYVLVVDFTGMKIEEFSELRKRLDGAGATLHVVKNTFLRKALKGESLPELEDHLKGQSAIVYGASDVAAAAKVLKTFAAEFERPKVKVGILDRSVLDQPSIYALADLPSREVLLAQLLGLISQPANALARLINTPAAQLAQVLKAKSEKGD
ncbi:MAG: 50S ribosomal protein L10 [Candidatus Methylacidiphilales bacterium]